MISTSNRSFRYGDGLFETMKIENGKIHFFDRHIARLTKGMQILKMQFKNEDWIKNIEEEIYQKVKERKLADSSKVRLQVFRESGGEAYIPKSNFAHYVIDISELNNEGKKEIKLGLYPHLKKPQNILSNLKTSNCLYSIMAGIYATENGFDDCILLNESGFISEAISSNVFAVKNNTILTPSLDQGCLEGIQRAYVIEQAKKKNIKLEERQITVEELLKCDEIFLTNVIHGVITVKTFADKTYTGKNGNRLFHHQFFNCFLIS
jgi:branched-chain amino acid aminotransferase